MVKTNFTSRLTMSYIFSQAMIINVVCLLRKPRKPWVAVFATTGIILAAAYALWLYRRVVFGQIEKESLRGILDMSFREKVILVPLVALTILFGIYPAPLLDATAASVDNLVTQYQA